MLPLGCGQKIIILRNLGASDVEVRVRGSVNVTNAIGLTPSTTSMDYVLDNDIHSVFPTRTASAGAAIELETSIYYGGLIVEARVVAAAAAGTAVKVVAEFAGQSFGVR